MSEPKQETPKYKVLVVEDTVELAEIIRAVLERLELTVFHETHGGKALEVFKAENPDLLLLDLSLPDMSGWKVLDTIKDEGLADSSLSVIVITAYGDPANRVMGKLQEVHDYLLKPLKPDEVKRVVVKALKLQDQK